ANNRLDSGTDWWLTVEGRLKPGWSLGQATAQLQAISPSLFEATLPANYPSVSVKNYLGFKLEAVPVGSGVSLLRRDYERSLWLLLAVAGLVLLIACAHLAHPLLPPAGGRGGGIARRPAPRAARRGLLPPVL